MGLSITIHKRVASKISAKLREIRHQSVQSEERLQKYETTDTQSSQSLSSISETAEARDIPSIDECKTHLKFLKVLYHLREDVSEAYESSSSAEDQFVNNHDMKAESKDEAWNIYMERAARRFEVWWKSLASKNEDGSLKQITIAQCLQTTKLDSIVEQSESWTWTEDNMLPIDVLMVLHSYMLNPRCFLEDCIRYDMIKIWRAGMPWDIIEKCVSTGIYEYNASAESRKHWYTVTSHEWENSQDTILTAQEPSQGVSLMKLRTSLTNLRDHETPLPGTLLAYNGEYTPYRVDGVNNNALSFADEIMSGVLGERILKVISDRSSATDTTIPQNSSRDTTVWQRIESETWSEVKEKIASLNTDKTDIESNTEQISMSKSSSIKITGPASIKRFLAAHSHQSIFSLDLAAAVRRQCLFIDTMQGLSWLYNPGLNVTITSLIQKYTIFIKIIGRYPGKIATPTHAVDLAWHTHQCSPHSYYNYCLKITEAERPNGQREFIDHDDKLSDTVLTGAFEWTTKTFEEIVGGKEEYSECLCWYCTTKTQIQQSIQQPKKTPGSSSPSNKNGKLNRSLDGNNNNNNNNDSDSNINSSINIPEPIILERIAGKQHTKLQDDYNRELTRRIRRRERRKGNNFQEPKTSYPSPLLSPSPSPSPSVSLSPQEFLETYKWLYPNAIPELKLNTAPKKQYKKATPDKVTLDALREQERLVEDERAKRRERQKQSQKMEKGRKKRLSDRVGDRDDAAKTAASTSNMAIASNGL